MKIKKIENVIELIEALDEVHIPFLAKQIKCDELENPEDVKSFAKH